MTKKKVVSTLAAATLAVTSSMTAFAGAATPVPEWGTNGGQSEVTGDSYAVQPVIEVELPAELTFGVNPMKLDADGDTTTTGDNTQILSTDYLIINYSNVPVEIKTQTKAEYKAVDGVTADPIEFLDVVAASNWDSTTHELKNSASKRTVLLVQQLPTGAATVGNDGTITMSYTNLGNDEVSTNIAGCLLNGTANEVYFLLDKKAAGDNPDPATIGGFTFTGAVNPNTAFYDSEITVTTVFTCNIITDAQKGDNTKYTPGDINGTAGTAGVGKATGYHTNVAKKLP